MAGSLQPGMVLFPHGIRSIRRYLACADKGTEAHSRAVPGGSPSGLSVHHDYEQFQPTPLRTPRCQKDTGVTIIERLANSILLIVREGVMQHA